MNAKMFHDCERKLSRKTIRHIYQERMQKLELDAIRAGALSSIFQCAPSIVLHGAAVE